MSSERKILMPPPPLVALAGWVLPGAGYWLIGQRLRGVVVGVTILLLFVAGLLIGGMHVIDAPTGMTMQLIFAKPWFIGQVLAGPVTLGSSYLANNWGTYIDPGTLHQMTGVAFSHSRVNEIGVLYTAVAGMLNLMAMIDSSYRASNEGAPLMAFVLAEAAKAFEPFRQPLPVWDYWYLLLIPLCLGVSIVYKAIKCREMKQVPREAAVIFTMILLGMAVAAAALLILVRVMEKR